MLDRDFSGSMNHNELSAAASIMFFTPDDIGPRGTGERDFIFYQPDPSFVGPRLPYLLISDGFDSADYRKTVDTIMGKGFSHPGWTNRPDVQFFFDEADHLMHSYKMTHDMPVKDWSWSEPTHKPGETPRGTKPSFIGGIKKSKQQRAAMKARRKQR